MTPATTELAAESARSVVLGCQFAAGCGWRRELAAEGAVSGAFGCQFGLLAGAGP